MSKFIKCTNIKSGTTWIPLCSIKNSFTAFFSYTNQSTTNTYTGWLEWNVKEKILHVKTEAKIDKYFKVSLEPGNMYVLCVNNPYGNTYSCQINLMASPIARDMTYLDYTISGTEQGYSNDFKREYSVISPVGVNNFTFTMPSPAEFQVKSLLLNVACRNVNNSYVNYLLLCTYNNAIIEVIEVAKSSDPSGQIKYTVDGLNINFTTTDTSFTVRVQVCDNVLLL